jgi:peroxiredoxin/outer membrane lipoprotein-sorting protein
MLRWGALLLLAVAVSPAAETAASILQKVAEVYANARTFRLDLEHKSRITRGGTSYVGVDRIRIAFERPGKLWLSVKPTALPEYLVVNDGQAQWTYVPSQKEYSREDLATVGDVEEQGESGDPVIDALRLADVRYQVLPQLAQFATIVKEDSVKIAGQKIPCVVIAIDIPSPKMRREIWVDRTRFLVLSEYESREDTSHAVPQQFEQWLIAKTAEVNTPIPAGTFTFKPPAKARRVGVLAIRGVSGRVSLAGRRAPDFTLDDMDGNPVNLASLRGKVVLIDFWATWCGPCLHELPIVNRLGEELRGKGLVVLGIDDEGEGEIRSFLKKHNYTFTVLHDSKRTVSELYGARVIPSTLVIGRDGVVVRHFVGARGEADFRAALRAAGIEMD